MFKILVIVFCLVAAGYFDKEAVDAELALYCDNVRSHVWPDYKKIYKKECVEPIDKKQQYAKI